MIRVLFNFLWKYVSRNMVDIPSVCLFWSVSVYKIGEIGLLSVRINNYFEYCFPTGAKSMLSMSQKP